MRKTLVMIASIIAASPAYPVDVMIAKMDDGTVRTQASADCQKLLRVFKTKGRMRLTLTNPPYTGYVTELHCVLPDGNIL